MYTINLQEEKVKGRVSQIYLSIGSNLGCIWQGLSSTEHTLGKASLRMSWLGQINSDS